MNSVDQGKKSELRIGDVFHAIMKHTLLILVLSVCGLIVGIVLSVFSYLRGEMSRTYAITTAIAVTSQTQDGLYTNKERTPGSTDITLAEDMTDSVIYVIRSDKTLDAAIQRLNLVGISVLDIYKNLSVTKYGSTQIVEMTLYWRDAKEGVQILDAINSVAPDVLSEVLQIGNVSVVNNPKSQYRIGGSVNAKLWVLMVLVGFMIGVGISVLELITAEKFYRTTDISSRFHVKLLGEIPQDKHYFSGDYPVIHQNGQTWMDEKISGIARVLETELRKTGNGWIGVTATCDGEGSSSVTACLGYRLSEMGKRVLLVDLNMQDPELGMLLDEKPDYYHSLNGYYYGDTSRSEVIRHLSGSLDLVPVVLDTVHPCPINDEVLEMLRGLGEGYDYVLMDLPPAGFSSTVLSIHGLTDQILYIARCDMPLTKDMTDTLTQIKKAGMQVIGCIVNGGKEDRSKQGTYKKNADRRKMVPSYGLNTARSYPMQQSARKIPLDQNQVIDDSLENGFEEYRPREK